MLLNGSRDGTRQVLPWFRPPRPGKRPSPLTDAESCPRIRADVSFPGEETNSSGEYFALPNQRLGFKGEGKANNRFIVTEEYLAKAGVAHTRPDDLDKKDPERLT